MTDTGKSLEAESGLGRIVRAALDTKGLAALEAMLRAVAVDCGAFGAALWQARIDGKPSATESSEDTRPAKESDLPDLPPERTKLFVLAHGFEDQTLMCAYHDLPLWRGTGQAIQKGEYESPDCGGDRLIDRQSAFFLKAATGSLFAIRIRFEDGNVGALTLYRRETGTWRDETKDKVRLIGGRYLPALYSAILDRISYRLVEAISGLLDRADEETPGDIMQRITEAVADSLACRECSIFLEDRLVKLGTFVLAATSCRDLLFRDSFVAPDPGFTAMVARERKPVLVLDLTYSPSKLSDKARFAGAAAVESRVRDLLKLRAEKDCPPISFVAVPILVSNTILGVLRCQLRPKSPYYFSEAEVELLRIIAARVGLFWNRHLRQRENRIVTDSWETFVDELNTLETHVRELSTRSKTANATVIRTVQEEIFAQGITAIQKSIRGADIIDVALVSPDRTTIEPIVLRDTADKTSGRTSTPAMKLPLHPENDNSWAYVFHNYLTQRNFFLPNAHSPAIPYRPIFPDVKQALFTPIVADNACIGVLSIRSRTFFLDVDKARRMASLVALQVALYHQLTSLLSQQSRTYQDLAHQLRTPIFQARKRMRWVIEQNEEQNYDLQAVNGLLAKTQRVLGNMRLYEELSQERVSANKAEYPVDALLKLITEACADNRVLWRSRKMTFTLDRESFSRLRIAEVRYDSSLIEQVMNNLLDNAGKYSRSASDVAISGALTSDKHLEITVKSRAGLRIEKEHLPRIGERGFRSEKALRTTAEGSGIGLYLVKQIMLSHGGELRVAETDANGFNRISITLPA